MAAPKAETATAPKPAAVKRPDPHLPTGLRDWRDFPVVVVGSGPSLTARQVRHIAIRRLEDKCRVIAVGDAIYPLLGVGDWLHSGGGDEWWCANFARLHLFAGLRTMLHHPTQTILREPPGSRLTVTGDVGFDPAPVKIRHGGSSGYQAVHEALKCGTKLILLVGLDYRGPDNAGQPTHYFGEHRFAGFDWAGIGGNFRELVAPAKKLEARVVNCSPRSTVDAFERGDVEALL